jgi:hypothetical protein
VAENLLLFQSGFLRSALSAAPGASAGA